MLDREKVMCGLMHHSGEEIPIPCDNCPYDDDEPYCSQRLAADALALLKEQEPRVLSRSEAESYSEVVDRYSEKNPLYVEHKEPHPYNMRWATNETVGAWMSKIEISRDYGIDFRFWTSRPSEQQMRDTKWEGNIDAE